MVVVTISWLALETTRLQFLGGNGVKNCEATCPNQRLPGTIPQWETETLTVAIGKRPSSATALTGPLINDDWFACGVFSGDRAPPR